jgi:hypothetical protein
MKKATRFYAAHAELGLQIHRAPRFQSAAVLAGLFNNARLILSVLKIPRLQVRHIMNRSMANRVLRSDRSQRAASTRPLGSEIERAFF